MAAYTGLSSLLIAEPIQSRCAVLRYSKLGDDQIMMRLMEVVEKENLHVTNDGLEAIIFTAQGDMRQVRSILRFYFHVCIINNNNNNK